MQLEDVRENIEYLVYVLCHLFRSPALTVNWLNPCDWIVQEFRIVCVTWQQWAAVTTHVGEKSVPEKMN